MQRKTLCNFHYWRGGGTAAVPRRVAGTRALGQSRAEHDRPAVAAVRSPPTAARTVQAVLAEQLLALVAEQCAVRPTILVVDDLQWADQASVTLWGRLARSARQVPLLLSG